MVINVNRYMDTLLNLQKRGFYIGLYFFPNGRYEIYIGRWDTDDFNNTNDFDTLESSVTWAEEMANKYESAQH